MNWLTRRICLCAAILTALTAAAETRNVVFNGDFEMPAEENTRPPYWFIGFSDSPESVLTEGEWVYDTSLKTAGAQSIRLSPLRGDYMISQVLDAPTYNLTGKRVRIQCDIRHEGLGTPPTVILLAVNPELPPDPGLGAGIAGSAVLSAAGPEGAFKTYSAEFTATDPAAFMFVVCSVTGTSGGAWFDNLSVEMEVESPAPDPAPAASPISGRSFQMGFVQENPLNISERAAEEMVARASEAADVLNVFFHVRWCALTGESVEYGHRERLKQARLAKSRGMGIALTLDFTHENENAIGDLALTPDGRPIGSLNDPAVRAAYIQEMRALCDLVSPEIVIVGIEADIFHDRHPEQWAAYVSMFREIAQTCDPDLHVTAYFTMPWMVDTQGNVNAAHAAVWRQLLPELESVAYSTYPEVMGLQGAVLPDGYFSKAAGIVPGLPVILPEFGVPGGTDAPLNQEMQRQLLNRIVQELTTVDVRFLCWFSLYDQQYLGYPGYLAEAFRCLGMHGLDGSAKTGWALWKALYAEQIRTGLESNSVLPDDFECLRNTPNPFNPSTTIVYRLKRPCRVRLSVFDLKGRPVQNLVDAFRPAGFYRAAWDGQDHAGQNVPSGTYLVRLTGPSLQRTLKVTLIR